MIKVLVVLLITLFPSKQIQRPKRNPHLHLYWITLFTIQSTCPTVFRHLQNFSRISRASEQYNSYCLIVEVDHTTPKLYLFFSLPVYLFFSHHPLNQVMVNHPHLCHFFLQMFNLKNNVLCHPLWKMLMWLKQKYYRQSKQFSHTAHYVLVIFFLSYLLGFLAIVWLQNRLHLQKQMQLFHKF